jgi:hypothetical protein
MTRRAARRNSAAILAAGLLALAAGEAAPQAARAESLPDDGAIVAQGLFSDGREALVTSTVGACWSARLYAAGADAWRQTASAAGLPTTGGSCAPFTAAMAADGPLAVIYSYNADEAQLLEVGEGRLSPAGRLSFGGDKSFETPPPAAASVSPEGGFILLGAPNYGCIRGVGARRCGQAVLFERSSAGWSEARRFEFPQVGPANIVFGGTAVLGRDAQVVVVGGPGHLGDQGELFLYERQGEIWEEAGVLVPDNAAESTFGGAAAITPDGRLIAVGSDQSAYLFGRDARGWALFARLEAPEASAGMFGAHLALSGNGRRLLVGAPRSRCGDLPRCGAAFLYERDGGGNWQLVTRIDPPEPRPFTDFGWRVALDAAGRRGIVQGDRPYVMALP